MRTLFLVLVAMFATAAPLVGALAPVAGPSPPGPSAGMVSPDARAPFLQASVDAEGHVETLQGTIEPDHTYACGGLAPVETECGPVLHVAATGSVTWGFFFPGPVPYTGTLRMWLNEAQLSCDFLLSNMVTCTGFVPSVPLNVPLVQFCRSFVLDALRLPFLVSGGVGNWGCTVGPHA